MASLVLDLQRDATSQDARVTDLLRKALLVAKKLELEDFEDWISKEMNGYPDDAEVPEYRMVQGRPMAITARGTSELSLGDSDLDKQLAKRPVYQSAGEIEHLVNQDDKVFSMGYPPEVRNVLVETLGGEFVPKLQVYESSFAAILDKIKGVILEWSTELEGEGVIGEDMTFSDEEKERAVNKEYTINVENMENSQIQQGTDRSTQEMNISEGDLADLEQFVQEFRELIEESDINDDVERELRADLAAIESQVDSPNPKPGIVKESLTSLRSVLEGVGGSLLASGVAEQIPALLISIGTGTV